MVQVCPRDTQSTLLLRETDAAGAALLHRPEVLCERPVAQVQCPCRDHGVAEALKKSVKVHQKGI